MARLDSRLGGYLENFGKYPPSLENFPKYPPPLELAREDPPLREFWPKMADFTGNSAILFAIIGNFWDLTLIID